MLKIEVDLIKSQVSQETLEEAISKKTLQIVDMRLVTLSSAVVNESDLNESLSFEDGLVLGHLNN